MEELGGPLGHQQTRRSTGWQKRFAKLEKNFDSAAMAACTSTIFVLTASY
jgi:hypothetical protein